MSTITKPPSTRPVNFRTDDGKLHHGFFLRDANKYVRAVNRWKDTDIDAWFDDDRVVAWGYEDDQIEGQMNLFDDDVNAAVCEAVAEEVEGGTHK